MVLELVNSSKDRAEFSFLKHMSKNGILSKFKVIEREVKVIYVSSYIPRECGIGTYTKDLTNAINELNPRFLAEIMVLDDPFQKITYPWEVKFKIDQNKVEDYIQAADYINRSSTEVVNLQHEFGLNGGVAGEYAIHLAERIKKPLLTTFHTVLKDPTPKQKEIVQRVSNLSVVVIVMISEAVRRLRDVYGVDEKKIVAIPHGVPDIPYGGGEGFKEKLGLKGKTVISTINLISRNKGLEYTIEAMPEVVRENPEAKYLIIGVTHPVVARFEDESYRHELEGRVKKLKIQKNVEFINRYLPLDELVDFLRATDIYITPYLNPQQITSGALAYAVGAGKSCISTPYIYAEEVLAEGRGKIVPFKRPEAIGGSINYLLKHPKEKKEMELKAYSYGRQMTWSNVALRHLDLFQIVAQESKMKEAAVVT